MVMWLVLVLVQVQRLGRGLAKVWVALSDLVLGLVVVLVGGHVVTGATASGVTAGLCSCLVEAQGS